MAQLSKIGFYLLSGVMGAVGVAAVSGVLDTPPRGVDITPAALVGTAQPGAKTDAKAPSKEKDKQVAALNNSANDGGPETKASREKDIYPTYDVLRVEKDGSTLIAGNAASGSTVEIVIGGKVVATTTAGGNGDFVAILEEPLKPGEHHISIRSTGKDNKVLVSLENGLVSIPTTKDGELLAMVMKPGEASRVLQAPAKNTPATPKAPSEPAKTGDVPSLPKEVVKTTDKTVDKADDKEIAAVPSKDAAPVAGAKKPEPVEETKQQQPKTTTPQPVEKAPTIVVEAVEVEGGRMFVAGAAEPGRRVAVYVDNVHVGFATGTRNGRFLLEVDQDLARGFHVVRADIFDAGGVKVAARAEVPLVHEPEPAKEVVVAANTPQPKNELAGAVDKDVVVTKSSKGGSPTPKEQPDDKSSAVEKPVEATKVVEAANQPEKPAELPKADTPVVSAVKETGAPKTKTAKSDETPKATADVVADKPAADNVAKTDEVIVAKSDKPAPKKAGVKADASKKPAVVAIIEPKEEPAKVVTAPAIKNDVTVVTKTKVASLETGTKTNQTLLRTGSSVIIRKGDSLWRISYRTYGRGIRYSTIYQANLRQLKNPHRIYPGQILKVPRKNFDSGS